MPTLDGNDSDGLNRPARVSQSTGKRRTHSDCSPGFAIALISNLVLPVSEIFVRDRTRRPKKATEKFFVTAGAHENDFQCVVKQLELSFR